MQYYMQSTTGIIFVYISKCNLLGQATPAFVIDCVSRYVHGSTKMNTSCKQMQHTYVFVLDYKSHLCFTFTMKKTSL